MNTGLTLMAESHGFHLLIPMDPGLCRLLLLLHRCYLVHKMA